MFIESNKWHLAAAALMALTTFVHVFAGGPESYAPLRASNLPAVTNATLSVAWHVITWFLVLFTIGLAWLSRTANIALAVFIAAAQLGFAAIFIGYGIADFGNLTALPQWIVFLIVPALMWCAQRSTL